ncbi:MAG TPA: cellulose-binding domain-containing protein [Kineosporiaceae bacterium]|nr:cellulose-binding domain-containing protein [Kineosporiaceae bacterium]
MRRFGPRSWLVASAGATVLGVAAGLAVVSFQADAATCKVDYRVDGSWPGGFEVSVTVTNLGGPVDGWTTAWSAPGGQRAVQFWNTDLRQSGSAVTARNAAWNGRLDAGARVSFGFIGAPGEGGATAPTSFTLNGTTCTGTGGTAASAPAGTRPVTTPPVATQPSGVPSTTAEPPVPPGRPTPPAPSGTSTTTAAPRPTATPTAEPAGQGGIPNGYQVVTDAKPKSVRVFWLKPSDVPFDPRWPDGMARVVRETQRYYRAELGKTFTLNDQVVEVVEGDHPRSWYENTPQGDDRYWWAVTNMEQELHRKLAAQHIDGWVCIGEVSAEGEGGGGGGGNGWVVLSQHDADGAAGLNGDLNRWYGGMVHEMGHALGLPDSPHIDGTPMSASFYVYPDTHFNQQQKQALLTGPWASFLT